MVFQGREWHVGFSTLQKSADLDKQRFGFLRVIEWHLVSLHGLCRKKHEKRERSDVFKNEFLFALTE